MCIKYAFEFRCDNVSCLHLNRMNWADTVNCVVASGFFCHLNNKRSVSNKLQCDIQYGVKILCTDPIRKSDNTFNKQHGNVGVAAFQISHSFIHVELGHLNLNTQCSVCVFLCDELDWIRKIRQCALLGATPYTIQYYTFRFLTYFMRLRSSEKKPLK